MATRVIYAAAQLNTLVEAQMTPQQIFDTLKTTYAELAKDGTFSTTTNGAGETVMTVSLKEGKKA